MPRKYFNFLVAPPEGGNRKTLWSSNPAGYKDQTIFLGDGYSIRKKLNK